MPKKFKEANSKSAAARERKAASKQVAEEKKKQDEEDESWRDDDKYVSRKQERKVLVGTVSLTVQAVAHRFLK